MDNSHLDEPSVLDYVKAKLAFWKHSDIHIPAADEVQVIERTKPAAVEAAAQPQAAKLAIAIPWRTLFALVLAIDAQFFLDPPRRSIWPGVILYILAYILVVWAFLRDEWRVQPLKAQEGHSDPLTIKRDPLLIGIPVLLLAFLAFGPGEFDAINLILWGASIALFVSAFWLRVPKTVSWRERLREFVSRRRWQIAFTPWSLLILAAAGLAIFFRFYHLNLVPADMTSDHAEKLLDVMDVLRGYFPVFFTRNTGREMLTFYLTAGASLLFGTGISYMSLKLVTVLAGLLTLPYIYLLGKEVGNRWVGFYALLFAAIAYWPNVISRIGQRFSFYPLLAAPTLYYLIRGIRRSNRNDFIFAGIALGIGLHGYTPMRIVPFVVVAAVALYLLHKGSRGARAQTIFGLVILAIISFVIFLPLFRYMLSNPEIVAYRSLTRLGTLERPLPGSPLTIFLGNLWNGLTMFFWSDGVIWVHSVPDRPALDIITAALFFIGVVLLWARYLRQRNWLDLFLLLSVPMLMLPSILSLAFPTENPSLNRTAAAYIPVFVIVALAFDGLMSAISRGIPGWRGKGAAISLGLVLIGISSYQNYDLTLNQWGSLYRMSTWNTTEIGHLIRDFAGSVGDANSAWVVPYPYWVDTRLVGMNAGYPGKDYALARADLPSTTSDPHAKLFVVNAEDQQTVQELKNLYPQGDLWTYTSQVPTKDFLVFFVPAQSP
jgi:drug/metabolite transporter superfamily protein YnfA